MNIYRKLKSMLAIGLLIFVFSCENEPKPRSFTITFDSQGGTAVDPIVVTEPATTAGTLPIPTKIGYVFSGWFTIPEGKGAHVTETRLIDSDMTVYAFWQHVPYTVTFDSQGGTSVSPVIVAAPATTVETLPTPPTKAGFVFAGWSTMPGGTELFTASTPVTDDITVYAIWNKDWIAGTLPGVAKWQSVAYGNGIFVAIAYESNKAATSSDGVTWTAQTLPDNTTKWLSIGFGNGVFVAVASGSNQAASSPDGVTWTPRTMPLPAIWTAVTYGNGIFLATTATTSVATSQDGITWTYHKPPGSFINWHAATYGNGIFTIVAYAANIAMTSPDGINWTQRDLPCFSPTGDAGWNSVVYGNSTFVAVSTGGCAAGATSSDGVTWTDLKFPDYLYWEKVAFGDAKFVAIAAGRNQAITSNDGIIWTYRNLPGTANWSDVAFGNGIFVAISSESNQAAVWSE